MRYSLFEMLRVKIDGLNDGYEAIASISPVVGSITTAVAAFALSVRPESVSKTPRANSMPATSESSTRPCVSASIVSQTSFPDWGSCSPIRPRFSSDEFTWYFFSPLIPARSCS